MRWERVWRPFLCQTLVRSCPKNVQNMAPGHFSMRKKRNLQFWQNRARNCKSCELFKFGSFSPIQPTIPLISIAELWSRKTLKRPMIWYIFERQMVRGPQKQCSQVSDIQIHKYTNTVWVKFENRPNMWHILKRKSYKDLKNNVPKWKTRT